MATHIFFSGLLALCFTIAIATDNSPLQDFCIADSTSPGMISLMHTFLPYGYMQIADLKLGIKLGVLAQVRLHCSTVWS